MSMMICRDCGTAVDTDDDPDSLYVEDMKCVCRRCRPDDWNWHEDAIVNRANDTYHNEKWMRYLL